MINKRLIGTVPDSKPLHRRKRGASVVFLAEQCRDDLLLRVVSAAAAGGRRRPRHACTRRWPRGWRLSLMRGICTAGTGRMSFLAARSVKRTLRRSIYEKLLRLGPAYSQNMATSEAVQLAAEGVEQLETYFGAYLPQFFYSMLAPATLFALLAPVSLRAALALLVCVPLIPAAIAAVQTWAKKLLGPLLGPVYGVGRHFSGKPAGADHTEDLSGRRL